MLDPKSEDICCFILIFIYMSCLTVKLDDDLHVTFGGIGKRMKRV